MIDDLISRDALRRRMYHEAFETDNGMQRWDSGLWIRYKIFENAIEEAPAVEPERKRGKWFPIFAGEKGYSAGDFRCSVCGEPNKCYCLTKYCANCGAEMGGE